VKLALVDYLRVKVKVKLTVELAIEPQRGSTGIAVLFL
jgi:hypothetical protein